MSTAACEDKAARICAMAREYREEEEEYVVVTSVLSAVESFQT